VVPGFRRDDEHLMLRISEAGHYENRFTTIDQRLAMMAGEFNQRFAKVEGELKLLSWMLGFNLAATIGVFFLLLRH
jgi:hypothetical protein